MKKIKEAEKGVLFVDEVHRLLERRGEQLACSGRAKLGLAALVITAHQIAFRRAIWHAATGSTLTLVETVRRV